MTRLKFFFTFLFSLLFFSASAQVTDSLAQELGDTLETIESDTSIIYVIQAEPVTIRERVEIIREKIKIPVYFSMGFSLLRFSENRKATSGYENYTAGINSSTKNMASYSIGAILWRCPKKIYYGLSIDVKKINQQFRYIDINEKIHTSNNRFNYADLGIQAGYWIRKDKKTSLIPFGAVAGEYLLSYSGFTNDKVYPGSANRLDFVMSYRPYLLNLSAHVRFMFAMKTQLIELEPYFIFSPFSATAKNEAYSAQRTFIGVRIGLTNKLF